MRSTKSSTLVLAMQLRRARGKRAQRGVSLIELMVVVAIIGVLVTTALAMSNSDPDVDDVAHSIGAMISEAGRQAISYGAVDRDSLNTAISLGLTEVRVEFDADDNPYVIVGRLNALSEFPEVSRLQIDDSVKLVGYRTTAEPDPGTVPEFPIDPANPMTYTFFCQADGSCTPLTFYLESAKNPDDKVRLVVIPVNGMTIVLSEW